MKGLSMSSLIYSEHLCAPISALCDIMHYVLEGPSSHSYLIFESVTFDELFYSCAETDKRKERHNPFLYDILRIVSSNRDHINRVKGESF